MADVSGLPRECRVLQLAIDYMEDEAAPLYYQRAMAWWDPIAKKVLPRGQADLAAGHAIREAAIRLKRELSKHVPVQLRRGMVPEDCL